MNDVIKEIIIDLKQRAAKKSYGAAVRAAYLYSANELIKIIENSPPSKVTFDTLPASVEQLLREVAKLKQDIALIKINVDTEDVLISRKEAMKILMVSSVTLNH